ncbi:MAG: hypothetical protein P8Y58_04005 [Novosphingobium sp.]
MLAEAARWPLEGRFESQNAYARAFRLLTGQTPTVFRRRSRP